ncbi:MAG: PilZ domain-containing protein [Nitrospirae bacterium]|nr:PilZ domain-containing protein [Nitrospirota bacterium]
MHDKRRYKRYLVDVMEINSKMILASEVQIIDISVGGVSLKVDRRLNLGSEYLLTMENKGRVINVKAMVVWSMISGSKVGPKGDIVPIYTAGMKFTQLNDEKIKEIAAFIDKHKLYEEKYVDVFGVDGLRLHVRVRIDNPDKAILNTFENYKVKKLSLGGLLLESNMPLETETRLPMEVDLSEDKSIKFTGRIASCIPVKIEETEHYDLGIEFLDMSEKDREVLQEFIKLLSYIDEGLPPLDNLQIPNT